MDAGTELKQDLGKKEKLVLHACLIKYLGDGKTKQKHERCEI